MCNNFNSIDRFLVDMNPINVYNGLEVAWPTVNDNVKVKVLSEIREICLNFNNCYSRNNGIVSFVYKSRMFVTPYTRRLMGALAEGNFMQKSFYVPFSCGGYPLDNMLKFRWLVLLDIAKGIDRDDFRKDCENYCNEHHIGAISNESLVNSIRIPDDGILIEYHDRIGEDVYHPRLNGICDTSLLGTYSYNYGCTVFVYRNGDTYIAKGSKIISELRSAGFREERWLNNPFTYGGQIKNPSLRAKYELFSE